jgi:trimethylamine--corrinoid protein Co-methyltransferase
LFEAQLSDSENAEHWEEHGSEDMQQRAFKRWNKLLDVYTPPPIDPALDDALKEFVSKRKAQLPDQWY